MPRLIYTPHPRFVVDSVIQRSLLCKDGLHFSSRGSVQVVVDLEKAISTVRASLHAAQKRPVVSRPATPRPVVTPSVSFSYRDTFLTTFQILQPVSVPLFTIDNFPALSPVSYASNILSLFTARPTVVYVTDSTRPTVVSVTGPPRSAAVSVTGSTRPTVVSVTGPPRQAAVSVTGSTRPTVVSVTGPPRSAAVSVTGSTRSAAVSVTGSTRPTVVSVTGPPRSAAVSVAGSTRPTVVSVTGLPRQAAVSVTGPPRPAAVYVTGSTRPIKFKGAHSILSIFYPCSIRYKGKTFPNVEHAYQYTKAIHHKDLFMARLVFTAATAWECKILSHRIATSRHWFSIKKSIMTNLFQQVPPFKQFLLETTNRPLLHNVGSSGWGTGLDGTGLNTQGVLLMQLRDSHLSSVSGSRQSPSYSFSS